MVIWWPMAARPWRPGFLHLWGSGVWAAVAGGVFGAGAGFRVGWRALGGVWFPFFRGFLLVLAKLSFWRGAGRWPISLWGLNNFLMFPNFLRS